MLACSLLLALSCKSSDKKDGKSETEGAAADQSAPAGESGAAAASGKLYDKSIKEDVCALLTTDMVAAVAKKPVGEVEQKAISSMCRYEWEGGNAGIAFVRVHDSVEDARQRFERSHKNMSGEEVKDAMKKIGEGAEKRLEEDAKKGKKVPNADAVKPVTGAMAKSMAGGITFEAVEGLGDMAAYETTRHENTISGTTIVSYANNIDVLVGNMSFDISFSFDGVDHKGTMQKDEAIALAKAVIAALPSAK